MAVNAADAWQQSGPRADRPYRAPRVDRAMAAERPARPRSTVPPRRVPERPRERSRGDYYDEAPQYTRPPAPRRPEHGRPRDLERGRAAERHREHAARRPAAATETGGTKLRGILAVAAVFLVTLAAAGVESFLATGLGTITLAALVASTVIAAFLVRRRDLLSVVVCPPLVFAAVAVVNMVAAPSVHLSGVKAFGLVMITLLVQNFPAMAVATGAGLVIAIIRWAARR